MANECSAMRCHFPLPLPCLVLGSYLVLPDGFMLIVNISHVGIEFQTNKLYLRFASMKNVFICRSLSQAHPPSTRPAASLIQRERKLSIFPVHPDNSNKSSHLFVRLTFG